MDADTRRCLIRHLRRHFHCPPELLFPQFTRIDSSASSKLAISAKIEAKRGKRERERERGRERVGREKAGEEIDR